MLLFGLVGVLGLILILLSTPWGIGVSHDSVYYLDAAENVLAGDGLSWRAGGSELRPLTHYPPAYSLTLATVGLLGIDLVDGARAISAVIFALNLMLIGWLIHRYIQFLWAALGASTLALLSPIFLDVHFMALTEPLFLFFLLTTIAAMVEYLRQQEMRFLVAAGVLASLANLTRYAGLSLTVTVILAVLLLGKRGFRQNGKRAAVFAFISLIPLIGWNVRNQFVAGSTVGRVFMYHPIPIDKLKLGARALLTWILPEDVPFKLGVGLFLVALTALVTIVARNLNSREEGKTGLSVFLKEDMRLPVVSLLFVVVYGLFLVVSLLFVDASTPLDIRILSPAYLMTMVAVFAFLGRATVGVRSSQLSRYMLLGLGALLFVSYVIRSMIILTTMREQGRGFTERKWETSELIVKVREMDEEAIIYSSDALRVYFLTGRPAYSIPQKLNPVRSTVIDEYGSNLELMRSRLKEPGAALVLFSDSFELARPELPLLEEITEGLSLFWNTRHGVIYIDPINAK